MRYSQLLPWFVKFLLIATNAHGFVLCLIIYRTRIYDWLKASILTASLTTFMVGIGVQIYETPIVIGLVMLFVSAIVVLLLHRMKKKWYHYYVLIISVAAALFYL